MEPMSSRACDDSDVSDYFLVSGRTMPKRNVWSAALPQSPFRKRLPARRSDYKHSAMLHPKSPISSSLPVSDASAVESCLDLPELDNSRLFLHKLSARLGDRGAGVAAW